MKKRPVFKIRPKIKLLKEGQVLKNKKPIDGTNSFLIPEEITDPLARFENDEALFAHAVAHGAANGNAPEPDSSHVFVSAGESCIFIEDEQFIGSDGHTPNSAWVRWKLVAGEHVLLYTLLRLPKSIWDFYTMPQRKQKLLEAIHENFYIIDENSNEEEVDG